jgi:hypothetical protein
MMWPLLIDRDEAAAALRTSVEVVDELVRSGALKSVHIDGDPAPKFRPEDLLGLVEHACGNLDGGSPDSVYTRVIDGGSP